MVVDSSHSEAGGEDSSALGPFLRVDDDCLASCTAVWLRHSQISTSDLLFGELQPQSGDPMAGSRVS
jgi:hypothetical protein